MSSRNFRIDWDTEAVNALESIYDYGVESWSVLQADKYLSRILEIVSLLGLNPEIGRSREDIGPDLRSFPVENHIIYYRTKREVTTIVALLHASVDTVKHFEKPKL